MNSKGDQADLTGKNRLVINAIVGWASHLVLIVAGFIMPRMIDQHIGQVQLGVWDFCWSFVSYLNLLGLGVGSAVNRYVAKYRVTQEIEKLNHVVSSVAFIQAILALLVVLGTGLIIVLMPQFYSEQLGVHLQNSQIVVALLGVSLAIQIYFDTFRGIITGCHRWDIHNGIHAAVSFVSLVIMMLVLLAGEGIVAIALAYSGVAVLFEVIRIVLAKKIFPQVKIQFKNASFLECKRMLNFGWGTVLFRLPPVVLVQTVSVLLVGVLGPAALAIFSRPIAIVRHIKTFISKFSFILTPTVSSMQDNIEEVREFLLATTKVSVALTLPMIVVLVIFGDMLMELWMGAAYAEWLLVAILALGYFLPISQDTLVSILIGMNRHGRIAWILLIVVTVIAMLLGWWIYASGWALAKAAIMVVVPLTVAYGILLPIYVCQELELSHIAYWASAFFQPIMLNFPSVILLWYAREQLLLGESSVAIGLIVGSFFILMILYFLFIFPDKLKRKVYNIKPIRKLALAFIYYSGILSVVRFFERKKITIFMLHGVMSSEYQKDWVPLRNHISPANLDATLAILKKNYHFISLEDAVEMLSGKKKMLNNSIVITFDDGYRNNVTLALPILKKYGVVPTIFIATHYIDECIPYWFDRIDYSIQLIECNEKILSVFGNDVDIDNSDRQELQHTYQKFRKNVKRKPGDGIKMLEGMNSLASQLEEIVNVDVLNQYKNDEWIAPLSWSQIYMAVKSGDVKIGSHTVDHVKLNAVSKGDVEHQLRDSKKIIESKLGVSCEYFCYPYGDYDDTSAKMVEAAGYRIGLCTDEGKNALGDNLFALKRYHFPVSIDRIEVLYFISGLRNKLITEGLVFGK